MISLTQIGWLAGLLEGEGSFVWHKTIRDKGRPRIQISMCDKDIIARVANYFNATLSGPYGPYKTQKQPYWYTHCSGKRAIEWMMTIFPLMGERRKIQITPLIQKWKEL